MVSAVLVFLSGVAALVYQTLRDARNEMRDTRCGMQDRRYELRDTGYEIFQIPDHASRITDPGSRIPHLVTQAPADQLNMALDGESMWNIYFHYES
jgi:hypothetical protein